MDENTNTETVNVGAEATTETNNENDVINMTKADYEKDIQSAEDKLRTKYSKEIKNLEEKITELTPAEKSDAELALEKRLAALETKEKEAEAKENHLALQGKLQSSNIDMAIADYLKPDIDFDSFIALFSKVVNDKVIANGYKPTDHQTTTEVTSKEWDKMPYSKRAKLCTENPTLGQRLMNTK